MIRLILALLSVASFACFLPGMHDWINQKLKIKKFYIPWVGLVLLTICSLLIVASPFRGILLGVVVMSFGLLLWFLPEKPVWRGMLENMFFAGHKILEGQSTKSNAAGLMGVGLVTIMPHTGPALDTLTVLMVAGYFIWKAVQIERGHQKAEATADSRSAT